MYDSFDMACRDAPNALQLNIKVNSENLLPNAQKYNVGTLRLPADPSWPKIPQRKLVDDFDDIIEPPCVVTLTGTPRKSRSTVRPSNSHQSSRSNFMKDQVPVSLHPNIYQKIPPSSQPMKRRPGCADPRFKKVTTVKSQMTSTDPPDRDNPTESSRSAVVIPNQTQSTLENVRKTVPEKDTDLPKVTQQEAEKPGEIRGMDSIGVQTMTRDELLPDDDLEKQKTKSVDASGEMEKTKESIKTLEEVKTTIKNVETSSFDEGKKEESIRRERSLNKEKTMGEQSELEKKIDANKDEKRVRNLSSASSVPVSPQLETPCLQYCNNSGQLFLVVEKKAQASAPHCGGGVQIDSSPLASCQYTTQCYNVQVPVLSYQNLPLQISTQQQSPKVEISSQLSLGPVLTIPSTPSINNHLHQHHHQFDTTKVNFSRISEAPECLNKEKCPNGVQMPEKTSVALNDFKDTSSVARTSGETSGNDHASPEVEAQRTRKTIGTPPVKLERKPELKVTPDGISESFKASRIHQMLSDTTDSEMYGLELRQLKTSRDRVYCSKETSGSGSDYEGNVEAQYSEATEQVAQATNKRRNPAPTRQQECYSRNYEKSHETSRTHRKMKSEQNLPRSSGFCGKNHISDPHITGRETHGFKDNSTYATTATRRKDNGLHGEGMARKETCFNADNNDITTDDLDSDVPNVTDCCETHRTDLSHVEKTKHPSTFNTNETTNIPVKTQQLLNKSYMEYYDKLRSSSYPESSQQRYVSQMAMGAPQLKKRRAEISSEAGKIAEEKESKIQVLTMEKLSALSNIINRNLNPTLRNSSDPMQTKQLYVNENMKSSSDPTAVTQNAVIMRKIATGLSADIYDSSAESSTLANKVKRKREKPVERRLLKLKTIAFFSVMMYATIVLLPMMYTYFLYDEYEDYEDLSYIELLLEYVVSSFREAFGGLFDSINEIFFQPVSLD